MSEMGNLEDGNDQYWYLNLPEAEPEEVIDKPDGAEKPVKNPTE